MQANEPSLARALLRHDPLLLGQILLARARVVLTPVPKQAVRQKIGGVVYEFDFADPSLRDSFQHSQPAMQAMRHGSYEPTLRRVMRRCLKPGGTFIDVGANIGYISAFGASLVGTTGQVHSFEPVPKYFRRYQRLVALNPKFQLVGNNVALGAEDGEATITLQKGNIGANSLVPDQLEPERVAETLRVPVRRLGDYLIANRIERPLLIKIDVEGFEYRVIQGMADYFASTSYRPPLVCEVNAETPSSLGYTLGEFADHMASLGYAAYRLVGHREKIDITRIVGYPNLLFLPGASR